MWVSVCVSLQEFFVVLMLCRFYNWSLRCKTYRVNKWELNWITLLSDTVITYVKHKNGVLLVCHERKGFPLTSHLSHTKICNICLKYLVAYFRLLSGRFQICPYTTWTCNVIQTIPAFTDIYVFLCLTHTDILHYSHDKTFRFRFPFSQWS